MPGQTKTINKIINVLKWTLGGLGLITAFIPGLQPVSALLGMTSGAMSIAGGINNMIQQKQNHTLTTANKIGNITDIIGGSLGIVAPAIGLIGDAAQAVGGTAQSVTKIADLVDRGIGVAEKANSVINAAATIPNTVSQIFRKKDYYDNNMNFIH
jgi:hypothetical protein